MSGPTGTPRGSSAQLLYTATCCQTCHHLRPFSCSASRRAMDAKSCAAKPLSRSGLLCMRNHNVAWPRPMHHAMRPLRQHELKNCSGQEIAKRNTEVVPASQRSATCASDSITAVRSCRRSSFWPRSASSSRFSASCECSSPLPLHPARQHTQAHEAMGMKHRRCFHAPLYAPTNVAVSSADSVKRLTQLHDALMGSQLFTADRTCETIHQATYPVHGCVGMRTQLMPSQGERRCAPAVSVGRFDLGGRPRTWFAVGTDRPRSLEQLVAIVAAVVCAGAAGCQTVL